MSWLTDDESKRRCCYFKRQRERFLLFPSPPFPFLFFHFSVVSLYPPGLFSSFLPRFKLFLPPRFGFLMVLFCSVRSLSSVRFYFSLVPPFRFLLFSFSFLYLGLASSAVFIGQRGAGASLLPPYHCVWGEEPYWPATAPGWPGNGRGWQGTDSLGLSFMRVCGVSGGGRAYGVQGLMKKEEENKNAFSSPAARPGEEERGTVSFTMTPLSFFFFLFSFFNMKRCRFGQNVPFHLNKKRR